MTGFRYAVAVLLFAGLATAAAAESDKTLMQEVEAFGATFNEALLAGEVDTMLALYTEDAISLPNFGPRMDGIGAFKMHHDQMSEAGVKIQAFESDPTDVWECGNQVIEVGTFTIALEMPGMPGPIEDEGKYVTVYVRDAEGHLKIKLETWNTDQNPMEMGAAPPEHEHGHDHEHGH